MSTNTKYGEAKPNSFILDCSNADGRMFVGPFDSYVAALAYKETNQMDHAQVTFLCLPMIPSKQL